MKLTKPKHRKIKALTDNAVKGNNGIIYCEMCNKIIKSGERIIQTYNNSGGTHRHSKYYHSDCFYTEVRR